jgi:hypothetical protein
MHVDENSLAELQCVTKLRMCWSETSILGVGPPIIKRRSVEPIDDADDEGTLLECSQARSIGWHPIDMREALFVAHDGGHAKVFQPGTDGGSKITKFVTRRTYEYLESKTHLEPF